MSISYPNFFERQIIAAYCRGVRPMVGKQKAGEPLTDAEIEMAFEAARVLLAEWPGTEDQAREAGNIASLMIWLAEKDRHQ